MSRYHDLTRNVVDQLVAMIETDTTGTWSMPWHRLGAARHFNATNATTGIGYRGTNSIILAIAGIERGYEHSTWATYKQWANNDAQVRRSEKGTQCVRWIEKRDNNNADDAPVGEKRRMIPSVFTVFNAGQVDGTDNIDTPDAESDVAGGVDGWIAAIGADVVHGGDRAYYDPSADRITLPPRDRFHNDVSYLATAIHEHAHWTGHRTRLDRATLAAGGIDPAAYAREELIAELAAAIGCAQHDITAAPAAGHGAYLKHWLEQLNEDPRLLFTAATAAQAAIDHLNTTAANNATTVAA